MTTTNQQVGGPPIQWDEHRGNSVTIRAAHGSMSAHVATRYVRPADDIIDELEILLDAKDKAHSVDLYLIDPLPEVPGALTPEGDGGGMPDEAQMRALQGAGERGVLHFVQNDEPAGAIGPALAEYLVRTWFGPEAASAGVLIEGLGALAAAKADVGQSVEEANEWIRTELAAGRTPVVVGGGSGDDDMVRATPPGQAPDMGMDAEGPPEGMEPPPGMEGPPEGTFDMEPASWVGLDAPPASANASATVPPAASASFLHWLMTSAGPGALRQFFEIYTPERRDQAALEVFRQPLAALEERWLQSVSGQKPPTVLSFFKFLLPLMKPHIWSYLETFVYMMVSALFLVAIPIISGCMVDALARSDASNAGPDPGGLCGSIIPALTRERVLGVVGVLFFAYLLEAGLEVRRAYVEANLYNTIGITLRERMFGHLLRLPQKFFGKAQVGDIAVRLSGDLEQLQAGLQQIFGTGVFMLVTSILAAGAALAKSWTIGAVILIVVPVFIFVNRVLGKRIAALSYEIQELDGQTAAILQETLSAQAVVKAFGLEKRVMAAYLGRLKALVRAAIRLMVTGHLYEGTISFATTFAQLMVLTIGSLLVLSGNVTDPGTLVTLLLLLPSIIGPLRSLAEMGEIIQTSSGSMQRVTQILDEPLDIDDKPDATELPPISKEIHFEDVHFAYDPERPIIQGLDLTIPHGTNVAIVGPSGSGKSTIVNLLLRFWDPGAGAVRIDGTDIRDVTMSSLRRQIGIVFQDTFVFNTTLRDNISMARPEATDAEVVAAAEAAQLQGLIRSLPAGLDTVLGERGVRMSGGQRQRLAIARALLRDPGILIFDEATSALDARTETEIRETISHVVSGRTTISITHRLSIAADADLVVVLDEGKVVEMGTHHDLKEAGGLYQQLYEEQTGHVTAIGQSRLGPEAARLRKVSLFSDLGGDALASLAERLLLEKFAAGEEIVRQGEVGDKLYILTRGSAEVAVLEDGRERSVSILKEGDYFGELAVLTGEVRSATVRTTQPTEVYSLAKDEFARLVESDPRLQQMLSRVIEQRMAAFTAATEAVGQSQT